jgi:hypothetical protein
MKQFKIFATMCMVLLSINSMAQNVGINNTNPQAALDLQGDLRLRSTVLTLPANINNDVDLTTVKSSVYMFAGGALTGCQITGFTGGIDGRIVTIFNNSTTNAIQLYDANFSISPSAAANKILTGTGSNAIIYGNGSVTLRYDGAKAKWIVMNSTYTDGLSATLGWNTTGNAGTNALNFIGTVDNKDLNFRANNFQRMKLDTTGRLQIGADYDFLLPGIYNPTKLLVVGNSQIYSGIMSSISSEGNLQITNSQGLFFPNENLKLDGSSVQADLNNTTATTLKLNPFGGNVAVGTTVANEKLVVASNGIGISQQNSGGTTKIGFYTSGSAAYLQTHTNNDLLFSTNNGSTQMILTTAGNVGIGTTNPTYKLAVNGNIRSKEVVVETGWADYVFAKDYKLPSLNEVEKYIKANNHLPEIPSAQEIQTNGLKVGELQTKMMQKIEELTLYIIEQNKKIEALEKKLNTNN